MNFNTEPLIWANFRKWKPSLRLLVINGAVFVKGEGLPRGQFPNTAKACECLFSAGWKKLSPVDENCDAYFLGGPSPLDNMREPLPL
jgi:hypothetical protein